MLWVGRRSDGHLKKGEWPRRPSALLAGTGWLPEPLRRPFRMRAPDVDTDSGSASDRPAPTYLAVRTITGPRRDENAAPRCCRVITLGRAKVAPICPIINSLGPATCRPFRFWRAPCPCRHVDEIFSETEPPGCLAVAALGRNMRRVNLVVEPKPHWAETGLPSEARWSCRTPTGCRCQGRFSPADLSAPRSW